MGYIVTISADHKAHIINVEDIGDGSLTDYKTLCGKTSDRWQLFLPEQGAVDLCKLCAKHMERPQDKEGGPARNLDGGDDVSPE